MSAVDVDKKYIHYSIYMLIDADSSADFVGADARADTGAGDWLLSATSPGKISSRNILCKYSTKLLSLQNIIKFKRLNANICLK